jgi:CRAL/TRIO domain
VPDLKCKNGYDVFYMRPARYVPRETPSRTIINNLCYVMNCMVEKEQACSQGVSFLANMNGWDMSNFCTDYCLQFMLALQGRKVPIRVNLFLIVNPPAWFGKIWAIMKPMLAPEFRKKVHMIPESDLSEYLMPGYERYLPDDTKTGHASTEQMVDDFIVYRRYIEGVNTKPVKPRSSRRAVSKKAKPSITVSAQPALMSWSR